MAESGLGDRHHEKRACQIVLELVVAGLLRHTGPGDLQRLLVVSQGCLGVAHLVLREVAELAVRLEQPRLPFQVVGDGRRQPPRDLVVQPELLFRFGELVL